MRLYFLQNIRKKKQRSFIVLAPEREHAGAINARTSHSGVIIIERYCINCYMDKKSPTASDGLYYAVLLCFTMRTYVYYVIYNWRALGINELIVTRVSFFSLLAGSIYLYVLVWNIIMDTYALLLFFVYRSSVIPSATTTANLVHI